ncbi:hypothetical protein [Agromyces marinus]|uniref:Uncharacterized protein n=1 Tax=Agromyces marinus TaxID=1389020 RepID=A0ABM8H0C8_9MICO|nr:hypothetical protein [Agromyces marinus]UIP57666.1 hypothetical protein DSM26151_05310 [Agromyces marinus]BDZ54175.1 hypothetical protein GCM10025870_12480 [Agromyces marinus]
MTRTRTLTESLIAELEPRLADTAYTIDRTERGFDVVLDLADAKWWMPLSRNGLKETFVHQVAVDESARRYSVNDVARAIEWKAGLDGQRMPSLRAGMSGHSGTVITRRRKITIGVSDRAAVERVVDIAFDSTAVAEQIDAAAAQVGLAKAMGRDQRIGLVVGLAGLGIAVLAVAMVVVSQFVAQ